MRRISIRKTGFFGKPQNDGKEKEMHVKKYNDVTKFKMFGNRYKMILPRDMTEVCESAVVSLSKGKATPPTSTRRRSRSILCSAARAS